MITLSSWNVNGFRAISAKPDWIWFTESQADLVGLQETKVDPDQLAGDQVEPEGWNSFWQCSQGKKGYSGVAVFSRAVPLAVETDLPDPAFRGEGRYLHLEFRNFHYLDIYFPNGGMSEERLAYKLGFYDAFFDQVQRLRRKKPIVVCGDFNTAHRPVDLARPKENEQVTGFLPIERAWMDRFINAGYVDTFRAVHGEEAHQYSWWSYKTRARERNVGWRIDYFFVSEELRGAIRAADIEAHVRGSDHCPITLTLDVNW